MLKDIGAWITRKAIWFLLILIGFIAYWNLHPVWAELKRQVEEATAAASEAPKAKFELETIRATSINLVQKAKSLSKDELDQCSSDAERHIQEFQKSREQIKGSFISKAIQREAIDGQLAFTDWVKRECSSARSNLLNDVEKRRLESPRESWRLIG